MTERFDHPPQGWFVLDVMQKSRQAPKIWVALMVDVDPDDPQQGRARNDGWLPIPGEHDDQAAAWCALDDLMQTRH